MNGPWGYYAKWNKSNKTHTWLLLYAECNKTNDKTKLIDSEKRLVVARGERVWSVGEMVNGVKSWSHGDEM